MHGRKGHRQHQRNRQRDHQPRTHAQREEAHQQHDDQGLDQHLHELADTGLHCRWLVGHLAQLHACRQLLLQACEFGLQRLAEHKDVAAGLHRHGQPDRRFAHVAHAWRRRVVEAAVDLGHIADAEGATGHPDGEVPNLFYRVEAAGDAKLYAVTGRLHKACRHHRVLSLKSLFDGLQRHAQIGQLDVGKLDPDLFVLQPDQLDLADILHSL